MLTKVSRRPQKLYMRTVDSERYIALYFIYNMSLTKSSSNIHADNLLMLVFIKTNIILGVYVADDV